MSAFSVSDLLNPTPASQPASPHPYGLHGLHGLHSGHDTVTAMEDDPPTTMSGDLFAPELFQAEHVSMDTIESHTPTIFEQQGMIPLPMDHSSSPEFMRKDSMTMDLMNGMDSMMDDDSHLTPAELVIKKERSTKQRDPEKRKDTKHSSKNEGQHTDRRYLCYFCNKLFTRRRSVRDHIVKIHGEKTWEPSRSLEVIVEPHSGEPIEPIEDIVARGSQLLPPRSVKSTKYSVPRENSSDAQGDTVDPAQSLPNVQKDPPLDMDDRLGLSNEGINALAASTVNTELEKSNDAPDSSPNPDVDLKSVSFGPESESKLTAKPKSKSKPSSTTMPVLVAVPAALAPPTSAASVSGNTMPTKLKKEESERSMSRAPSAEPTTLPAPVIGRKRPLPLAKKGTAKFKSSTPSKRLKLTDSERSTPTRSPSATPATHKPAPSSRLKTPLNAPSPTSIPGSRHASPSPTPSAASAASSNDDGEIFCICRRGDNHTWMIACDGPCEEWFHGKCVGIRERDGELIDKYICPTCQQDGSITTWKRMCRRPGCRKPARVKDHPPSKYCTVSCGRQFFVDLIQRGDPAARASKDGNFILTPQKEKKMRKRVHKSKHTQLQRVGRADNILPGSRPYTPAYSEDERSDYDTDSSLDEGDLPNRGGPLRASEVKALLQQCKTIDSWRELGKKPETPPREVDDSDKSKLAYDYFESNRVAAIRKELADLDQKLDDLAIREIFLELVKTRSAGIADDIRKGNSKLKNVCGYDPRVAWSQDEFLHWCASGGKASIDSGKIGPPDDTYMTGDGDGEDEEKQSHTKGGVCIRNNCPKHGRTWQKSQLAELRFEQDLIKKRQDHLAHQDHDIRNRAQIRALEQQGAM